MTALIGALRVSLSADTAQFEAGMKRAQRTTQTSATAISKSLGLVKAGFAGLVSGLSIGLLTNVIKGALDYAGSLGEVSQQLGVTTRDLQVFRFAAGQVGVSQAELETGLDKLTRTIGNLAAGAKAPRAALEGLRKGLADQVLASKDTGEAFRLIADGLAEIPNRAQRAAVEVALFGRSGAKLDNLLSGGSAAINELADAADKLGIVLSDEQIRSADETADKLEALKTVLSARIAGVVADNAQAILGLADALASIVAVAGRVITALARIGNAISSIPQPPLWLQQFLPGAKEGMFIGAAINALGGQKLSNSATIKLGPAKPAGGGGGRNVGQFLAGGGGGRRSRGGRAPREDHTAERQLSDAFRFDQDIRRAQMDVLRATQDLSTDAVERYKISIDIKDAEKAAYEAELQYQVKLNELTKGQDGLTQAQADQLKAQYDIKDSLERQKLIADENARAAEDSRRLDDLQFELERDRLQSEAQLADTSGEQRDVQLRLLDLYYRQERARLEAVLADEQSSDAAKEEARRRLANLNRTEGNDRQGVIMGTRGPFEQWQAQFSDIGDELQQLKVNGIEAAADALTHLTEGWDSFRDAAISAIKQVIAELIRLQIMKAIANIAGAAAGAPGAGGFGGASSLGGGLAMGAGGLIPGFATGGSMILGGKSGVDRNILSLNGLPIARVSRGEPMHIGTKEQGFGGGGTTINAPITIMGTASRETTRQMGAELARRMADARKSGY